MSKLVSEWERLPLELRARNQWLLARPDDKGNLKVPTSVKADGTLYDGSSTNMATWLSFDYAVAAARHYNLGLGYVCSESDPFSVIDLDVKNANNYPNNPEEWSTQETLDRFWQITQTFDSYTEKSQSGQGLHIWLRGKVGQGRKRDGVEIYSQSRFMVCTGNVLFDKPIEERIQLLHMLYAQLDKKDHVVELEESAETMADMEIVDKLMGAVNGDKFNELCKGDWVAMGYPSQSEADLALMSMFTFHSMNNEQCRRLFRMSALGKREKAVRNDVYLNRTLKLVRGRQAHAAMAETHGAGVAAAIIANAASKVQAIQPPVQVVESAVLVAEPVVTGNLTALLNPDIGIPDGQLQWPPGMMGELAKHIYNNAPRPVKEVGIISALGLVAGICGRTYQLPQSGVNVYLVLVARSAVGKEAMHSGIAHIVNELMGGVPTIMQHVSYSDFASGPALVKAVAEHQCFVNVSGEWGRKLKRLSQEDGRDGPMQALRTAMTNLYQKSAITSIVGGLGYSDKEKSVASVSGVAYSLIGETTPDTFYESLTESMMADGFLSRFTILEYNGPRPDLNMKQPEFLPVDLKNTLSNLVIAAGYNIPIYLQRTEDAGVALDAFDKECTKHINSTNDESWRQMWNRAHLKVLRIAALLAILDNGQFPTINMSHVQWSLDLIRRDIGVMSRRISSGDVGTGDAPRERKLLTLMDEYIHSGAPSSYKIPDSMYKAGIIPRSLFQIRVQRINSFITHRNGGTFALDSALKSLCDSGYLQEVDRSKLIETHGFHGKAYRIVTAPHMPNK